MYSSFPKLCTLTDENQFSVLEPLPTRFSPVLHVPKSFEELKDINARMEDIKNVSSFEQLLAFFFLYNSSPAT